MVASMFEWKPPDPRLVALARRLEAAVHRLLGAKPAGGRAGAERRGPNEDEAPPPVPIRADEGPGQDGR